MIDERPMAADGPNRRENFRIDHVLPITIRKIDPGIAPAPHIFPISVTTPISGEWSEGGLNPAVTEIDANFALNLIEVNAKLDLLLSASNVAFDPNKDSTSVRLSLNQLLLQINIKLEHLLGAQRLKNQDQRIRIDTVNLSAGGIKLDTDEHFSLGDLVEVRMLMAATKPFWLVVTGSVVRSEALPTGKHEIAINFSEMDESIQDEISRYALINQKKQILARRGVRS